MKQYEQMSRDELILELRRRDQDTDDGSRQVASPYRSSLMSIREAFCLADIIYDENGAPCDYRYRDVNPAYEKVAGLPREQIINKTVNELFPGLTPLWMDLCKQIVSTDTPVYCCYYCDVLGKWLELYAFTPAKDRYAVLITDITERKDAYLAVRESEARLKVFIEHAPASLAMFDRDMNYLCASRRWIDGYGLTGREIIGRCAYDVTPEVPQEWREVHSRGLSGEVVTCDGEKFQFADGSEHWESWEVQPWYDGSGAVGGIVIFSEDISAVKQAEEALRKSEQRYREIVQNQTEYVDRYLPGGILTFVNDSLARITGVSPKELLGKSFYSYLHEEDREEVIGFIESLTAENPAGMMENRIVLQDGVHWMQWKHCALTDADGNIIEYQATGRDITEVKRMQDELLQHQEELKLANELLEQRVCERTAELEAAIRAQESFSYSVSHDLRAPLRHINSFSAMLMEDYSDTLPPPARIYLDRICAASNRMAELIDHLLELSRVTRVQIKPARVDLSQLAKAALHMFQEIELWRCVELEINDGITAMGDPSLLRQLLENVLGNAWKYTSKTVPARIEFGKQHTHGQEIFYVKDNGAGFDMAYRDKLFNPFERLHGEEFEGIGIGLATAQRIVQRHGGTIWAEGSIAEGATFYFTLPPATPGTRHLSRL